MAVKTITSANVAHWDEERTTRISTGMIHNAVYINQPSSPFYFIGSTTRLIPTCMIVCPLEERLVTGNNLEAFALNAFDINLENTTASLRDPDWESVWWLIPQEVLDRLSYLAALPENWYMHGSRRISRQAIEKAVIILPRIVQLGGKHLAVPFIAPSPDGGLALRWKTRAGTELHLEIAPNGRQIEYLFVRTVVDETSRRLKVSWTKLMLA